MGSQFVSLYICNLSELEKVIGSKNQDLVEEISEKESPLSEELEKQVIALIDGDYIRDSKVRERPDAAELLYAFEKILSFHATSCEHLEVYPDDEEVPELWNLIWDAWDEDSLFLPLSPHGVPVVRYVSQKNVSKTYEIFRDKLARKDYKDNYLGEQELLSLIAILKSALELKSGVFVFHQQ